MLDLGAGRPGAAKAVDRIVFTVPDLPFALCGRPFEPGDNPRVSAQFSIAFTAAVALVRGAVTPQDFLPAQVLDFAGKNEALIRNITVEAATPRIGRQATVPARARIGLKDGQTLECVTDSISGSARRPLTAREQISKLHTAGSGVLAETDLDLLSEAGRTLRHQGLEAAMDILRRARPVGLRASSGGQARTCNIAD
jgi:2-methylcitrate dehydratase PrpD